jgi:hypothetical protein
MFHDDLLIRAASGYEPTPKGQRLLHELESTLPRLDRLLSGVEFDPAAEEASFRIAATDHAAHVVCPVLSRTVLPSATKASFNFVPLHDAQFEAAEKGRIDLLLVADDGTAPAHFASEVIFEVDFVCVVAKESPFKRAVTLKQYLAADHIGINIVGGIQTIPEKRLAAIGAKRHCPMVVPFHTAAMRSLRYQPHCDCTEINGEIGGFQPCCAGRQGTSRTRDIQVPDGLAPSNEDRRGAYLAAVGHSPSGKSDIGQVTGRETMRNRSQSEWSDR